MEFLNKYPTLEKVINCGRIITGEARIKKNLIKICKNYGINEESFEEDMNNLLYRVSEREISMVFLIELLDDCVEYVKYKPSQGVHFRDNVGYILKTYNQIKGLQ